MGSHSDTDSQTAVDKLVKIASVQGYVTPDDVAGVVPDEYTFDEDFVDRIISGLAEASIEMREDAQDLAPVGFDALAGDRGRRPQAANEDIDDTISLYLREIGSIPLLTAEEEQELARTYELGRMAADRLADPDEVSRLSRAELALLRRQMDAGERAGDHLMKANLRLVVHIAKKYTNYGVPFADLIQDGSLGLMKAAEKFDWRRGHKFSTYATWWIRQSITRALADQSRIIRVPVHMTEQITKIRAVTRQLEQEYGGRAPTLDEVAAEMGMPPHRVEQIMQLAWNPVSMNAPVNAESDSELADSVPDKDTIEPSEYASQELLREAIVLALSSLTEREQQVLSYRFGLVDGTPNTLEEVGEIFGVTRERIRQIETKAIRRLRHPTRSNKLREYLR